MQNTDKHILNTEEQQKATNSVDNNDLLNDISIVPEKKEHEDDDDDNKNEDDNIVTDPEKTDIEEPEQIPPDAEGDPKSDKDKKKIKD